MDFSKFANMPIVDAHVHFSDVRLMPNMLELMDRTGVSQLNLLSTPHPRFVNLNPQAFHFKAQHPDRVYMFGALDYSGNFHRIVGSAPKPLRMDLVNAELQRIAALVDTPKVSSDSAWSTWEIDRPLAI